MSNASFGHWVGSALLFDCSRISTSILSTAALPTAVAAARRRLIGAEVRAQIIDQRIAVGGIDHRSPLRHLVDFLVHAALLRRCCRMMRASWHSRHAVVAFACIGPAGRSAVTAPVGFRACTENGERTRSAMPSQLRAARGRTRPRGLKPTPSVTLDARSSAALPRYRSPPTRYETWIFT